MEAGGKAQLRAQLLASENDVNTLSGFAANGKLQFNAPQPQPGPGYPGQFQGGLNLGQNYSNHDIMTPVLESNYPASSSRKASMNSMSMQKLFRRKGPDSGAFDDESGADIGDFNNDLSFNDISRLRGAGRYNTSASMGMDTAPIIPVLGGAGASLKGLNNVQYRKYMNHQKKLNLAQSARAMSLAGGGNPMAQQDPRSMSFTSDPSQRAMSLGRPLNGPPNNPRAMSLNSNAMLRNGPPPNGMMRRPLPQNPRVGGGPQPYGPNYNQNHQMLPNGYGPHPNAQHTMSLRTGPSYQQNNRPNPNGSRANSLNNMGQGNMGQMAFNGLRPMNQMGHMGHMGPNQMHMNQMHLGQMGPVGPNGQHLHLNQNSMEPTSLDPAHANQSGMEASNDSLMNVQEEDEEEQPKETSSLRLPSRKLTDEADVIYRFDEGEESPQISRKSTVKKSNSIGVRKLDLFKKDVSTDLVGNDGHPRGNEYSESDITEEPSHHSDDENGGARGKKRESKDLPSIPISPSKSERFDSEKDILRSRKYNEDSSLNEQGSANALMSSRLLKRPLKFKNLTQNTAFSQFRSPSYSSQNSFVLEDTPRETYSNSTGENQIFSDKLRDHASGSSADLSDYASNHDNNGTTFRTESENSSSYSSGSKDDLPHQELKTSTIDSDFEGPTPKQSEVSLGETRDEFDANEALDTDLDHAAKSVKDIRLSTLSRSSSELKVQGLMPSSAMLRGDVAETPDIPLQRKSTASLTSKSRSFIKRLSRSGSKRLIPEGDFGDSGVNAQATNDKSAAKPLKFSKEELSIMNCNNDLQNELQLVTNELALSIKRELSLEAELRSKSQKCDTLVGTEENTTELRKTIASLQEKLNKERRLRFISEEHAILAEHGQNPSALKLDYEKNEIYNQLLVKNDMVVQLQDKLGELQEPSNSELDSGMLHKFNDLLKENTELKERLGVFESRGANDAYQPSDGNHSDAKSEGLNHEYFESQIMSLRIQRDELREMITKLTTSQSVELKAAHDRVKTLESKLAKVNSINASLSKRSEKSDKTEHKFVNGPGGKLQGLSIVSQPKKFFDD